MGITYRMILTCATIYSMCNERKLYGRIAYHKCRGRHASLTARTIKLIYNPVQPVTFLHMYKKRRLEILSFFRHRNIIFYTEFQNT